MFILEYEREMCDRASYHIPVPDFKRAAGDALCSECKRCYYDHPNAVPFLWLRILCDGRYVKL